MTKRSDFIKFPEKKRVRYENITKEQRNDGEIKVTSSHITYDKEAEIFNQALADLRKLNEGEVDIEEYLYNLASIPKDVIIEMPNNTFALKKSFCKDVAQAIIKALTTHK